MKRRVLCFLLCVSFCFSLFSLNCSAVGSITHDELIEYGYVYDGVSYGLPSGVSDPLASYPMMLLSPEKNYPNFDPKKLPWSEAPSYIQEIIYMSLDGAQSTDPATYKMPFVLVRVRSATDVVVIAGYNIGLGYDLKNDRMRVCETYYFYGNSACYRCYFNAETYEATSDWVKLSSTLWGAEDVSKVKSYTSTFAYPTSSYDFYFYGGNGIRVGDAITVNVPLQSTNELCYFTADNQVGFQSGRFFYNDSSSTTIFCQTFVPPTVDQQEQETQKGIWETIKSIPGLIADQIKGLFIPREGYFTDLFNDLREFFESRLGILIEIPEAALDIFLQFYEFEPSKSDYSVHFPEVKMPVLDSGEWSEYILIHEQDISFDFINEGAFSTMYSLYRAAVWLIFVVLLINLIIRKANKILGGSTS